MPVNRKHHAVDTAPDERWALLARLFRARRVELGYIYRPAFAEDRLPRTPRGNLMIRALNAIENNERPGTYAPGRLEQFARAYKVTDESVLAVLEGKADELTPSDITPARILPPAPMDDPGRESAVRPYAVPLWKKLRQLSAQGVKDPAGIHPSAWDAWSPSAAQLGLPPGDAKVWDGSAGAMSLEDRAWLVADIQRRRDARNANSEGSAAGA